MTPTSAAPDRNHTVKLPGRPFWIAQVAGWGGLPPRPLALGPRLPFRAVLRRPPRELPLQGGRGGGGIPHEPRSLGRLPAAPPREAEDREDRPRRRDLSFLFGLVWSAAATRVLWPDRPLWPGAFKSATSYGITLLAWSALYLAFTYRARLDAETERALRADALASQARLEMLRYQVNPHFLFNALNSIRALIEEDRDKARLMVTELSEFFRYSLLHARSGEIPLEAELEAIRSYLAIQKIRFEERLEVTWEVSAGGAPPARLPGFLVHPLVENAVKHGMETSPMPLRIGIAARLAGAASSST